MCLFNKSMFFSEVSPYLLLESTMAQWIAPSCRRVLCIEFFVQFMLRGFECRSNRHGERVSIWGLEVSPAAPFWLEICRDTLEQMENVLPDLSYYISSNISKNHCSVQFDIVICGNSQCANWQMLFLCREQWPYVKSIPLTLKHLGTS